MSTVLLSTPPGEAATDLAGWLLAAGFAAAGHALGSPPAVDFAAVTAAVIEVRGKTDAAAAQTRRWRAELGDESVPIVWVLPAADATFAARGFDAGADAVLARPLDEAVFVAQIRAAARTRAAAGRVAARASEARLLGDQLQKTFAQIDRERAAARRIQRAFLPRTLPAVGGVRWVVSHRAQGRVGGDFYDARRLDGDLAGFLVGDVIDSGAAGSLLGVFVAQSVAARKFAPPGEVLAAVNRDLLALGLDDRPLVGLLTGTLNASTGELVVARAGLPPPVFVPADGEPEAWAIPGPFLGTAVASYPTRTAALRPGDRFVVGTNGTRPDGGPDELGAAVARHRLLLGQEFADAVAGELLARARHEGDFALLVVETVAG